MTSSNLRFNQSGTFPPSDQDEVDEDQDSDEDESREDIAEKHQPPGWVGVMESSCPTLQYFVIILASVAMNIQTPSK